MTPPPITLTFTAPLCIPLLMDENICLRKPLNQIKSNIGFSYDRRAAGRSPEINHCDLPEPVRADDVTKDNFIAREHSLGHRQRALYSLGLEVASLS